jgi:hypothetical protein
VLLWREICVCVCARARAQAHVYLSQLSALPGEVDELYELQSVLFISPSPIPTSSVTRAAGGHLLQ